MSKMNENENQEMEMEELDVEQLDQAAGGTGLRDKKKIETHDIDANTISRI